MSTEVIVTGEDTPIEEAAVTVEAAAAVALAEVAVAAIETTAERVDELAQARAALAARDQELFDLRASIDSRFAELEARVAAAQFTAEVAVVAAEEIADEVEEEIEDELEEEIEDDEIPAVLDGETVVEVVPLIEAENPPVLHEEAQQIAAKKKRGFIRI